MSDPISIYAITNAVNGKQYIGQTSSSISHRFKQHAGSNDHCRALSSAIRKYGVESFSIKALCVCPDRGYANEVEKRCIAAYGTLAPGGYNLHTGGVESQGHSDETRAILSEAAKKRGMSDACRRASRIAATGRKQSDETIAKRAAKHSEAWAKEDNKEKWAAKISEGVKKNWVRRHIEYPVKAKVLLTKEEMHVALSNGAKKSWETRRRNAVAASECLV